MVFKPLVSVSAQLFVTFSAMWLVLGSCTHPTEAGNKEDSFQPHTLHRQLTDQPPKQWNFNSFFTAPVRSSVLTYIFINFYLNYFQETNKLFLALQHLKCIHVPALQHGMSRQVTQGHKSFTNIFFFLFIFFIVNPFICSI